MDSTPEPHHHLGVAPPQPRPWGGNLVKESSEHVQLYVWVSLSPNISPSLPTSLPPASFLFFVILGSTDGCGV